MSPSYSVDLGHAFLVLSSNQISVCWEALSPIQDIARHDIQRTGAHRYQFKGKLLLRNVAVDF